MLIVSTSFLHFNYLRVGNETADPNVYLQLQDGDGRFHYISATELSSNVAIRFPQMVMTLGTWYIRSSVLVILHRISSPSLEMQPTLRGDSKDARL